MFAVYAVFCLLVFGCQYQCNQLPGKTRLRMTYYVLSGMLNPTHSLLTVYCDINNYVGVSPGFEFSTRKSFYVSITIRNIGGHIMFWGFPCLWVHLCLHPQNL